MSVPGRRDKFSIKSRKNRPSSLFASERRCVATYTLDKDYVDNLTLSDNATRKVLPLGTVLAMKPDDNKVVPNYTSYGFEPVGVLLYDADCGEDTAGYNYDRVVNVIWRGEVYEKHCWDNGTFGTVLNATKGSLSPRISFVTVSSSGKRGAKHFV